MCPLFEQASRILRAWSEDRRRSKHDVSFDPQLRECRAIEQYCDVAVKSTEVNMDKGQVYPYVDRAYKLLRSKESPEAVKEWHKSRRPARPFEEVTRISRASIKERQNLAEMRSSRCNTWKPQITLNNKHI